MYGWGSSGPDEGAMVGPSMVEEAAVVVMVSEAAEKREEPGWAERCCLTDFGRTAGGSIDPTGEPPGPSGTA